VNTHPGLAWDKRTSLFVFSIDGEQKKGFMRLTLGLPKSIIRFLFFGANWFQGCLGSSSSNNNNNNNGNNNNNSNR
jgi:hypothetical protein